MQWAGRDLFLGDDCVTIVVRSSKAQSSLLGEGYMLHFSFVPTKHPTADPKSFFCCWWSGCKGELSLRKHFPAPHAMPRDLTQGWAAARCNPSSHCSCAKSLRAQSDRITAESGQVPISPPDDRLAQGDTQHVRKCRKIISGQTRLK